MRKQLLSFYEDQIHIIIAMQYLVKLKRNDDNIICFYLYKLYTHTYCAHTYPYNNKITYEIRF